MAYHRQEAVAYAHRWAFERNPRYADFTEMGGDCTNFVSQCLHAGGAPMNFRPHTGWYYISLSSRAPAWSGVEAFFRFLTTNQSTGPYARETALSAMEPGDVVQLSFNGSGLFSHSLLVVEAGIPPTLSNTLVATHTYDSDYRPLDSWDNAAARYLHVEGARN